MIINNNKTYLKIWYKKKNEIIYIKVTITGFNTMYVFKKY